MTAVTTAVFLLKQQPMFLQPMVSKFFCFNLAANTGTEFCHSAPGLPGWVVCTASHNPKEYNGYKAYWNDGGQLVPPHDKNVIKEVEKIASVDDVKWSGGEANITIIGKEMDEAYIRW